MMTRYPIEAVAAVPFGHACSLLEEVAAIVDRVTFNAHIIETGTRSYRLAASTTAAGRKHMRTAHQLLTGWAFQLPGWSSHATWSQIRQ